MGTARRTWPLPLTRERVVAESAKVFKRRGYHAATLNEIAHELGVTKAAVYHHVRSKEELLFACLNLFLDACTAGVERALSEGSAPNEQLRLTLLYYIEAMTERFNGNVVLMEEGALSPVWRGVVVERRDAFEQMVRGIIERGVATGVFAPCDPKLVGFALFGAMNWILKWYDPAGPRSGKEIADVFSSFLVHGLRSDG
ncbi:MAG: TetR/AcrR family transcriptional regulator [Candidatus Rokubacteria bacterium]|nr:TetR/AcrR family transcriptional regulator [Candidatus Rokubacteria bacterium]